MYKVFISHSNEDNSETQGIAEALRRAGHGVWVDFENIRGGDAWLCEIQAGIEHCDAVVVVLSAASRRSSWVERECLYAFQLKKPMLTAVIADLLIPLYLINIQNCDLREWKSGIAKLLNTLSALKAQGHMVDLFLPDAVSRQPVEANFFAYVEQLPGGDIASLMARDLFDWARQFADELTFGGELSPGFHARVLANGKLVTALSVWAYRRKPSAQIPLDYLSAQAPFVKRAERRRILTKLNRILPRRARISADKVDRRPTFPLQHLSDAQRLEDFKELISEIASALRVGP
ncbi:MAG: toll/interleukin-1 receptor domain-containing protein [Chloroflexi bacterium]|nr:toll/interleukin-1 receptor domain-containing protein [Chloroflexota bacterium]